MLPKRYGNALQEVCNVTQEACTGSDICKRYEIRSKRYVQKNRGMDLSLLECISYLLGISLGAHFFMPLGVHGCNPRGMEMLPKRYEMQPKRYAECNPRGMIIPLGEQACLLGDTKSMPLD